MGSAVLRPVRFSRAGTEHRTEEEEEVSGISSIRELIVSDVNEVPLGNLGVDETKNLRSWISAFRSLKGRRNWMRPTMAERNSG